MYEYVYVLVWSVNNIIFIRRNWNLLISLFSVFFLVEVLNSEERSFMSWKKSDEQRFQYGKRKGKNPIIHMDAKGEQYKNMLSISIYKKSHCKERPVSL